MAMRFLLVHGTFSDISVWNTFERVLSAADGVTAVDTFRWSGLNSQAERQDAADRLAGLVRSTFSPESAGPLFLIGHSHGGNICTLAAGQLPPDHIAGVICISTPHFSFVRGPSRLGLLSMAAGQFLLGTSYFIGMALLASMADWFATAGSVSLRVAMGAGIIGAEIGLLLLLLAGWRAIRAFGLPLRHNKFVRVLLSRYLYRRRDVLRRHVKKPLHQFHVFDVRTNWDEAYLHLSVIRLVRGYYALGASVMYVYFKAVGLFFNLILTVGAVFVVFAGLYEIVISIAGLPNSNWAVTSLNGEPSLLPDIKILATLLAAQALLFFYNLPANWLLTAGKWNYGLGSSFDLQFVNISISPSAQVVQKFRSPVVVVPFSILRRMLGRTLGHSELLRDEATISTCLAWARNRGAPATQDVQ